MKIFGLLGLASVASAAIIPFNGLAQQAAVTADVNAAESGPNFDATILNDEGYRYKTVRRLKYRQRRDVSEIANEYLPANEEEAAAAENVPDVAAEDDNQDSSVLGDNGYEYKTVRRLKYRQRRDVSEIANEYLPPGEQAATEEVADVKTAEEHEEVASGDEPQESAVLGDNGYEYKTVRRLKYRQRRDVSEIANEYLPPGEQAAAEEPEVMVSEEEPQESAALGENGYEYKTVRRLKYRQRRDVSEIATQYLPPGEQAATEEVADVEAANEPEVMVAEEEPQESAALGENGYEYKTVRRLKYRQRRDVSEIATQYLPPGEQAATEEVADVEAANEPEVMVAEEEPQESAALGENGYEYKTVRRLKYRQRRDVSEIATQYLPPGEQAATEEVADVEAANEPQVMVSEEEPQESAALGENGYEYKTVRRLKYRQRRDVSEIATQYLPPGEQAATEEVADVEAANEPEVMVAEEEPQESAALGENGYEYKTVRRLKYRQRRDVSEIATQYLPPGEQAATEEVADVEAANEPEVMVAEEEPQESAALGENGYEYKTVRRLKYRQRRDVSEIATQYLPPGEQAATEEVADVKAANEPEVMVAEEEPQESAALGENGYEYKTVRRLKYRQRRDVSEIPTQYLPPGEQAATEEVSDVEAANEPEVMVAEEEPQESAALGENGYEYKTVRRLKYRQRRDVSEIPTQYLPPGEQAATEEVADVEAANEPEVMVAEEEPQESAALGENGYEYKTVRRLKYRQRRDVSEIATQYLPPTEQAATEEVAEVKSVEEPEVMVAEEEPQESAVLGDNGYEYKTVRRLKYRQRRDVPEITNEYLAPAEEASAEQAVEVTAEEEPQESAALGDSGYEYKTVRRLKYRQRRDVSEVATDYLPPSDEVSAESASPLESEQMAQDSAVLGNNGYEYKTVRRYKY